MLLLGIEYIDKSGPAGGRQLLIWSGVPSYLVTLTTILSFILGIVIPILFLIGGILFYKLRNKGRKLLIISMIVSIISNTLFIILGLMYEQIKNIGDINYLSFGIFIFIEIILVWLLSTEKVKIQFR